MKRSKKNEAYPVRISLYAVIMAIFWTALVAASLMWAISQQKKGTLETARIQARYSFMKDVIYRRWNAEHGGVYAPVTEKTSPNPYLDLKGRDIPGPPGKTLTMINPAFMTRQVHELAMEAYGIRGHITSLNPIRPKNTPDPWETLALKEFEHGKKEVSAVRDLEGHAHMRLMRPLLTEKGCLKCHRQQGYQEGDIRGGISISVPLAPLWAVEKPHLLAISLGHALIWLVGLAGIGFGTRRLNGQIADLRQAREEREGLISELETALANVKQLSGLLPICASCKKIRDDNGYWTQIEGYIRDHSEADFSHSICPECAKKLYPDFV